MSSPQKFDSVVLTGEVYESPVAASEGLGITKAQILWARKSGAPGFKNRRIVHDELLPWLRSNREKLFNEENDKNALECRKLRLQCLALEESNDRERRAHLTIEDHERVVREIVAVFQSELYLLPPLLPPDLAGNTLAEMESKLNLAFDNLILKIKNVK